LSSLAHLGEVHFKKAENALDAGDLPKARDLFAKAVGCYEEGTAAGAHARTALGSVLAQMGEHQEARKTLEQAVRSLEPTGKLEPESRAASLSRALNQLGLVARDMGDGAGARASFERAHAVAAEASDRRQRAIALRNLAGLDRAAGDFARAIQRLAESADLQAADGDHRGVALVHRQVAKLHLERGDVRRAYDAAKKELEAREAAAAAQPQAQDAAAALAAILEEAGDLAARSGELEPAAEHERRAVELRYQLKDLPGAGRALVAHGHVLLAEGKPRRARAKLEAARDALGEEGGPTGSAPVDLQTLLRVRAELWRGFAETDLVRLEARDGDGSALDLEGAIDADTATDDAREDPLQLRKRARSEAEEAVSLAARSQATSVRAAAHRTLARALAHDGADEKAREHFRAALELAEETHAQDPQVLIATALAYGRFLAPRSLRTSLEYLERAVVLAEDARERGGPEGPAITARLALALALHSSGDLGRARSELAMARTLLGKPVPGGVDRPEAREPPHRARLRDAVFRLERTLAEPGGAPVAASAVLRAAESEASSGLALGAQDPRVQEELLDLRRLQAIARQLAAEPDIDRQLAFLVDAGIELAGAERGFLILTRGSLDRGREDEVAFHAARNLERAEIERPDRKVSHTIARSVLDSGASLVTGDAQADERFRGAGSVAEQRLRSVVAVPLRVRGKVTGVLYLDHRYKSGIFTQRVVRLLESVSDHASLLLETSRLLREVRQKSEELARERERLATQVESQTLEIQDIREKLKVSRAELAFKHDYSRIVGRSRRMREVFHLLDKVTPSAVPVFIQGESGTGKELVARAIHWNGPRKDGPFVSENFAALADSLLESELFGHVKGSFTGALDDRKGLFEQAHGGTIFLDEIGDLSDKMQKDLLRVLEEREVRPIGGARPISVNVRVISATHRDLKQMVQEGKFRQDLYYRLNVFTVNLPPLRERKEDIPLLAERFLDEVASEQKEKPKRLDPAALRRLLAYDWPGNIRELKNLLERTWLLAKGDVIRAEDLQLESQSESRADIASADATKTWNEAKESFARRYLKEVLARSGGNISLAARESGMLRQAFQRLLKRHGIDPEDYRD
jgi:transcriptional regulator with GAF, ATPase, and Fis domain/tetratricopeptide (TPR) repeat protein